MELNFKITPAAPKNESGLVQLIMMGESIRQIWVNVCCVDLGHWESIYLFIMKFLPTYIYTNTYMRQGSGLGKAYHCPLPSVLQFTFIMKINPGNLVYCSKFNK